MLSFLGETPTIALQNAQKECGSEAVVISTKKISSKDKHSENMYEITIALEEEYDNKRHIPKKKIVAKQLNNKNVDVQFYDFKDQIVNMQESLEKVQKTLWEPKSQLYDLNIPPELLIFILYLKKMNLIRR